MKPDRRESGHKPRAYIDEVVKAASHPVRQRILKRLQQSTCLTGELEEETHESRHNLYHHLAVLKEVGLVGERMRSNRLKEFYLLEPSRPEAAMILITHEDDSDKLYDVLNTLDRVFEQPIPYRTKITKATITLTYEWEDEKGESR